MTRGSYSPGDILMLAQLSRYFDSLLAVALRVNLCNLQSRMTQQKACRFNAVHVRGLGGEGMAKPIRCPGMSFIPSVFLPCHRDVLGLKRLQTRPANRSGIRHRIVVIAQVVLCYVLPWLIALVHRCHPLCVLESLFCFDASRGLKQKASGARSRYFASMDCPSGPTNTVLVFPR